MKKTVLVSSCIIVILLSSFLSTVDFDSYVFIHDVTYILLASGICFTLVLFNYVIALRNKRNIQVKFRIIDLSVVALVSYLIVRYALSSRFNANPDYILFIIVLFISFFYVKNELRYNQGKYVRIILYCIMSVGILQVFYGFLQWMGLLRNLFQFKFGGSFGNPGNLTNFLAITYTVSLGLFFYEKGRKIRWLLLGPVVLHLFLIVVSQARTAWIACFATSLILLYYYRFSHINLQSILAQNKKQFLRFIFTIIIVLSLGVMALYKTYTIKPASANGRIFIWKLSAGLIFERPVFGHGYDSFVCELLQRQMDYFKQNQGDIKNGMLASESFFAFNDYLQITVEYGIIALVLFLFIIFRIFTIKNVSGQDTGLSLLFVCKSAIVSIVICMFFSYPMQNRTIMFCFFTLIALVSVFDNKSVFKVHLDIKYVLFFSMVLFAFLSFLINYSSQSILNGVKWKKAYSDAVSDTDNYVSQYDQLYHSLKHDRSFIMNYGIIQGKANLYTKCINHYEKYGYLCLSSTMYMMLGDTYVKVKNYPKAEESYINASLLKPHLFVPKYELFKIYTNTKQFDKANDIAIQISKMKIKVFSETVKQIKTEINDYLLSQNTQHKK